MNTPRIAVIGLGPMGHPIAATLLDAGLTPLVWNRTASRADDLVAAGAIRAERPADAAAPVILSVLPDVAPLRELLDAPTRQAWGAAGARLVVLSTTGPEQVIELAEELAVDGIAVVDAPMSGGVAGAAAGTLSLMVGGTRDDVAAVLGVLEVIGGTVVHLGPLGSGMVAKLCNQIVVGGTLAALAEAFALARRSGLDVQQLVTLLEGGLARSEVLAQKKDKLIEREYSLGGSADNQVKDLRYATAAAESAGLPARLLPALLGLYRGSVDRGDGGQDHAVVQELYLEPEG
ncbi:NAD(P)-dependent oxidoreductase [Brachybacterium fresconis]|uniref:2-hydroxy-3-oxopropionate reductase n=1 Tax=Brachybacterium fresconis TaxID=173363 RepID=A0ABS4YF06_9MICO|nr:NAD(P)-dependent oxidoreductase [Brachybacterium fresconis]MBP2407120.1 2-hydroxy-3-oxopropionate reductase [Brachybacterium fresconis]